MAAAATDLPRATRKAKVKKMRAKIYARVSVR
jgi:hypothetical protein